MDSDDEDDEHEKIKRLLSTIDCAYVETVEQVNWNTIGKCLQYVLSPVLRKYAIPIVSELYIKLKQSSRIHSQTNNKFLQKHPDIDGHELNYANINNNWMHKRNKRKFDYKVENAVEFSKLFLSQKMASYQNFDEICLSGILTLIINTKEFREPLSIVAVKVRDKIRNSWAHSDRYKWDDARTSKFFRRIQQCIKSLQLEEEEESHTLYRVLQLRYQEKPKNMALASICKLKTNNRLQLSPGADSFMCSGCKNANSLQEVKTTKDGHLRVDHQSPEDLSEKWVCLIKLYPWLKEAMDKPQAMCIASQILKPDDTEVLYQTRTRRMVIDGLLKHVLRDNTQIGIFLNLLRGHMESLEVLNNKIQEARPTKEEIKECELRNKLFSQPENLAVDRWLMLEPDKKNLLYKLKNIETIDTLNNVLLSRFLFSIVDHDRVCDYLMELKLAHGASCLLETMEKYPRSIMKCVCDTLESMKKTADVTKCLGLREKYCWPEIVGTASGSALDVGLMSDVRRNLQPIKESVVRELGFDVEEPRLGSILIRLRPLSADAWEKLKRSCVSGNIINVFRDIFFDEQAINWLDSNSHGLFVTIYSEGDGLNKGAVGPDAVLKLELISEDSGFSKASDEFDSDNPIERSIDILCEEMDICDELLTEMQIQELVPHDIFDKLKQTNSRASKIKCLLENISQPEKGYQLLKEYLRYTNSYLFQELDQMDNSKLRRKLMFQCKALLKKSSAAESYAFDQIHTIPVPGNTTTTSLHYKWLIREHKCFFENKVSALSINMESEKHRLDDIDQEVTVGAQERTISNERQDKINAHFEAVETLIIGEEDTIKPPGISAIDSQSCVLSCYLPEGIGLQSGFFVEQLRVNCDFGWIRLNEQPIQTTNYHVDGLQPGQHYKFRIVIEEGKFNVTGQETQEIEAIELPGAPFKPESHDITHGSCFLEWRPPDFDGGSPIAYYEIYKEKCYTANWEYSDKTAKGTSCIQIKGLTPNQHFRFKVRAANKLGVGSWSQESDPMYTSGIDLGDTRSLAVIETSQLDEKGMQSVSSSFVRGTDHLLALLQTLDRLPISPTLTEINNASDIIRSHASMSSESMQIARQKVETLQNEISKRIQETACEQGEKERLMYRNELELQASQKKFEKMQEELKELSEEKRNANIAYNAACANFRQTEEKLEKEKMKQNIVKGVGAGLFFLPGVGWLASTVAASVTLVTAFTVLEENVKSAKCSMDSALDNRNYQERHCQNKEKEIKEFETKLSDLSKVHDILKKDISDLKDRKTSLKTKLDKQTKILVNIQKCFTCVSVAKNRTEVLNDQLEFFYGLSSIIQPLKEVAEHLSTPNSSRLGCLDSKSAVDIYDEKLRLVCTSVKKQKNSLVPDHQKDLQSINPTSRGQNVASTVEAIDDMYKQVSPDAIEDAKLVMTKNASWDQFLGPAPLTIVLLGQLMHLSIMKDFSLMDNWHPPLKLGLQYLNSPNSFRASIIQSVDSGWRAFSDAQSGMDQIRMYAQTVPGHLRAAFKMLESASDEEISKHLQKPLQAIKLASDKCLSQSCSVEAKFLDAMNIMAELQEILVDTKSQNEEKLRQAKIDLKVVCEEQNFAEEKKKVYQKQKEKAAATINEVQSQFQNALASGPSTSKLVLIAVADAATSLVSKAFTTFSHKCETVKSKLSTDKASESAKVDAKEEEDEKNEEAYSEVAKLENLVDVLTSLYVDKDSLRKISDENKDAMKELSAQIGQIRNRLDVLPNCAAKQQAFRLCSQGIFVCETLENESKTMSSNDNKSLVESILSFQKDVKAFFKREQQFTTTRNNEKAPNRRCLKLPDASIGAVKYELEKVQQRIDRTKAELENAQAEYDKNSKKARQANERLSNLVEQLAKVDINKMDYDKIADLLSSSLKEMANLKEQWGKMVIFFQNMSNIIDCSMNVILKKLKNLTETVRRHTVHGYGMSHLQRDLLYNQVFQASEIAHFVSHVADTYTEVSNEFLLPGMVKLPLLLQFNPVTQQHELEQELKQLKLHCDKAQEEISSRIKTKKQSFDTAVQKRLSDIKRVEKNSMPKIVNQVQKVEVDDLI